MSWYSNTYDRIEKVLVKILLQRVKMNKPLTCSEGLDLLNSMIKDSPTAIVLREFKEVRKMFDSRNLSKDEKICLDKGY